MLNSKNALSQKYPQPQKNNLVEKRTLWNSAKKISKKNSKKIKKKLKKGYQDFHAPK